MPQTDDHGALEETWRVNFRHSAGKLGSHARRIARDEGRLLGWRSGDDGAVIWPPRDTGGAGDWVEIGPGAELLSAATVANGSDLLGRVRLDGASRGVFARLASSAQGSVAGARLQAEIDTEGDVVFYPERSS